MKKILFSLKLKHHKKARVKKNDFKNNSLVPSQGFEQLVQYHVTNLLRPVTVFGLILDPLC